MINIADLPAVRAQLARDAAVTVEKEPTPEVASVRGELAAPAAPAQRRVGLGVKTSAPTSD